jgi:hypothetical protein
VASLGPERCLTHADRLAAIFCALFTQRPSCEVLLPPQGGFFVPLQSMEAAPVAA